MTFIPDRNAKYRMKGGNLTFVCGVCVWCVCMCVCVALEGSHFGAPGSRSWASAHHRLKLTKKTQQDSWPETGMIGSPKKESEGA
jgi:hypothetical protein